MNTQKAKALLAQSFQLLSTGQLKEAQRVCRKALQSRPDLAEAHLLLSEIHHQGGDAEKARDSAARALKLRPRWSEAYFALGNAEALARNLKGAEEHFRAAIAAGSPGPGAHANLGHVLRQQGQLEEARAAYERALSHAPDALELQLNMALVETELGNKAGALDIASAAAARFPAAAQAHFALGNALADLSRHEEAIAPYRRALELDPGFSSAQLNYARALFAAGRNPEAIAALRELLARDPSASEPREQLLRVLHASRRFEDMEVAAREGMAIHPRAVVYRHQLGVALWWQQRHEDALATFDGIERIAQDRTSGAYVEAKVDQATSLLAFGRWREGWEAYQCRPTRITWRTRFPLVSEDPSAIAKLRAPASILVLGEQGLGDDIFFLRFAERLRERGHRLRGAFDPRLVPILAAIPGLFEELASSFDAAPQADLTLLSGDLPLATGGELVAPMALPVDPERRARFDALLRNFGPPPYIGVTWRAGALPDERKQQGVFYLVKTVPPEQLGAALRPLGATFCVVQRRPTADDQQRFAAGLGRPALDLSGVNEDLRDALAVLSVLDDYVGVSNTNTHLRAGCAGKPARVLVHSNPEWRWGVAGGCSHWFPEFSIYREEVGEGWRLALESLVADLQDGPAAKQHTRVG